MEIQNNMDLSDDEIAAWPLRRVGLRVQDMASSIEYYTRLGLFIVSDEREQGNGDVGMGVAGRELVHLRTLPGGRPRPAHTAGLYHFALLVGDEAELGSFLQHCINQRIPLDGASDHLVSQALYLSDPEGNGIEVYADRPRSQWSYPNGQLSMGTLQLNAQALLKQGLQEEGYGSVSQLPTITLTYASGVSSFNQEVTALVARWKKILGITVKTNPVNYNTLLDNVTAATNNAQGIQFWGLSWIGEYPDLHDWLTLQFDKASPNNNMNYGQNQSADATQQQATQQQMETADASMQPATRTSLYQQSEQQLVNDVAWLPMEQETDIFLRTPLIVGVVDNGQGAIPPDDWSKIYRVLP